MTKGTLECLLSLYPVSSANYRLALVQDINSLSAVPETVSGR